MCVCINSFIHFLKCWFGWEKSLCFLSPCYSYIYLPVWGCKKFVSDLLSVLDCPIKGFKALKNSEVFTVFLENKFFIGHTIGKKGL